jgi:hypothetical protein
MAALARTLLGKSDQLSKRIARYRIRTHSLNSDQKTAALIFVSFYRDDLFVLTCMQQFSVFCKDFAAHVLFKHVLLT